MDHQDELFSRLTVDVVLSASRYTEEGWECRVRSRREGGTWAEGRTVAYERLTPAELLDVIVLELSEVLGI